MRYSLFLRKITCFFLVGLFTLVADARTVPVSDIDVHRVGNVLVYTAQRGDSLYSIAFQHDKDYLELAEINHLKPPYAIHIGQKIKLTAPKTLLKKRPPVVVVKKKKTVLASTYSHRHAVRKKTTHRKKRPPVHHLHHRAPKSSPIMHHKEEKSTQQEVYSHVRHWRWPIRGRIIHAFSAQNKGIDISGHYHETVRASAKGKVVYAGNGVRGYGYLVIIKHNAHYLTAYGYNNSLLVKTNDWVKVGQPIAKLGVTSTGRITLHFEIRYKGKPINPARHL